MKRYSRYGCGILTVFLAVIVALIIGQAIAYAGSLTDAKQTYVDKGQPPLSVYTLTLTMDSGGTHSHAMKNKITGRVYAVKTNPGTPAPADNYDLDLLVDGFDVMGGALDNRDTADTEWALPLLGTAAWQPILRAGTVTVQYSGNTVANAVTVIEIWVEGM